MITPTKKKEKLEPTATTLRSTIGQTWFDIEDEEDHFNIESRVYGDVGQETAGKQDIQEGLRILKSIRKAFPESKWITTYDVVDEWVNISIRKAPLSTKEKQERKQKAMLDKIRINIKSATNEANERTKKESCRASFSSVVYEGNNFITVGLGVVFGQRLLYHNHLGAGFCYANENDAHEAIKPLIAMFPEYKWTHTISNLVARRTGNYPPPNNIIEYVGHIEYEYKFLKKF